MYNQDDDLRYAIMNNGLTEFSEDEILDIIVEVPGENDELSWWWILKLTKDRYALLSGWCDYTGWDCRSGLSVLGLYETALLAAKDAPFKEESSQRYIRNNLINQLKGLQPKFTYFEK